jgi:hypothetical protein
VHIISLTFIAVDTRILSKNNMSLRRIFLHHSHSGHRSRHPHSDSSEEFRRTFANANNQHLDDTHEQHDVVQPFIVGGSPGYTAEHEPHRTRRRSSVQILDKKFISLLNQMTPSMTAENDSNAVTNTSEDVCEL